MNKHATIQELLEMAKAKQDTENVRGLNMAAVKLTTVQVTKLPLCHKLEDLYIL
jgi:ribosomal 50S subunit-associated protein YjgA (DUF615 family)